MFVPLTDKFEVVSDLRAAELFRSVKHQRVTEIVFRDGRGLMCTALAVFWKREPTTGVFWAHSTYGYCAVRETKTGGRTGYTVAFDALSYARATGAESPS